MKKKDSKIIVALDMDNLKAINNLVDKLDPNLCKLKIGKEAFVYFGPSLVKSLVAKKYDVFLDLKFHDIPSTVAKAIKAAADLGVWMVNVHTQGGLKMLEEAKKSLENYKENKPYLIGVTILTSMNETEFKNLNFRSSLEEQVIKLADLAHLAKLDGLVCSAHEAKKLKTKFGEQLKLVTPGIRTSTKSTQDQARTMTPFDAIKAGSDYLVIGRPITQARVPYEILAQINETLI